MAPLPDFYVVLSNLFRQISQNPETLPTIPLHLWPAGSREQQLLESLQEAWTALATQGGNLQEKPHSSRNILETASNGEQVRAREQAALLEISQTLASALELQPGLILDQLRVIIEYTHATLFALEDSALVMLVYAARDPCNRG